MADDSFFLIDIDKILKEKLGAKAKYIPGFLVSYLKRIVHQEELNGFLRESEDKVGVHDFPGCEGGSGKNGEFAGRRSMHVRLQPSVGRTGRHIFGLCAWKEVQW